MYRVFLLTQRNFFNFFLLIFIGLNSFQSKAQCTEVITSSSGYDVTVTLELLGVVAPSSCPWGYNYNIQIGYDISFSGPGAPGSLYTLQATLNCGDDNLFFNLPNSSSSGSLTTTANPWNSDSDCATADLNSLGCGTITLQINGPGISNQYIDMDCATFLLPIELLTFTAKQEGNQVALNWITVSEINNDYFTIEKSNNGKDWSIIETMSGAGNSSISIDYTTFDQNPYLGLNYYRLKQTDYDGKSEYFEVKTVYFEPSEVLTIQLIDQYTIQAFGLRDMKTIAIYNMLGQDVTHLVELKASEESLTLNIEQLTKGLYLLNSVQGSVKFMRQ